MSDEILEGYVDRAKFTSDTDFIKTELERVIELFDKVKATKISLQTGGSGSGATSTPGGATKATDEGVKANIRMAESIKAVNSLIKERFASEAKLTTIQTDYAKATATNRLEIQKQNKELKDQAALNNANTGSIERARAAVRLLNTERNKLNLYTAEGREKQAKLNEEIDKYNAFIKKNVDALSQQKINVGNYQGSAKIIVDALEKEKQKLEELEKTKIRVQNAGSTYQSSNIAASKNQITGFAGGGSAAGFDNLKNGAINTEKEIAKLNEEIEKSRVIVEGFSRVTEQPKFLNIAGKVGDSTAELKFFQKALVELERNGLGNTEAAENLKKQLAELKDTISDTAAEVKALSSDTRGFDLFAGSISFAADAFQAFAGAAVLAGASEEDAAEATKTLVAVQSVANGVKGIANELTTKGTAANKIYAFAQRQVSVAMDTTAAASSRLRAALITIGIGALIVGIGLLVSNFGKIKEALGFANKAQEDYNETLKEYSEGAKSAIEQTNKVKTAFTQAREGVISKDDALKIYNETLGDTFGKATSLAQAEALYNEKAGTYIRIMGLKAQANALFAKSADEAAKGIVASTEDQTGFFDKLVSGAKVSLGLGSEAIVDITNAQIDGIKTAQDQAKLSSDALYNAAVAKATEAENLAKGVKINLTEPGKEAKKTTAKKDTTAEDALKAAIDQAKREYEATKAIALEKANELIRINQTVIDADKTAFPARLAAIEEVSEQKKKIAAIEYADAIQSEITVEKGKKQVIEKSNTEKEAAQLAYANKIKAIDDKVLEDQVAAQKQNSEKIKAEYEKQLEEKLKILDSDTQAQRDIAQKEYNDQAAPVATPEKALEFVEAVSDKAATHNCWAYRIGPHYRFSDDGEPGGTAGRPILAAIEGQGLDQVIAVVTRWYGGIKLGAGGLVRAYGGSAAECLRRAERRELVEYVEGELRCDFSHSGTAHALLMQFEASKLAERFDTDGLCLRLRVPAQHLELLRVALRDATRGQATLTVATNLTPSP